MTWTRWPEEEQRAFADALARVTGVDKRTLAKGVEALRRAHASPSLQLQQRALRDRKSALRVSELVYSAVEALEEVGRRLTGWSATADAPTLVALATHTRAWVDKKSARLESRINKARKGLS